MAVTYYYCDPRQLQGFAPMRRDENSLLDCWFYPNRVYMEEVRKENEKQEAEAKKKNGKGKDAGGGEGGNKKDGDKKDGDKKEGGKKEPDNKPKVIELKVQLCCEACARKVKKKIEKLDGVERGVICDMYENKVIVKGTAKPETVLKQAQKVKDATMWPQKKKEPEKKKDDKKNAKSED